MKKEAIIFAINAINAAEQPSLDLDEVRQLLEQELRAVFAAEDAAKAEAEQARLAAEREAEIKASEKKSFGRKVKDFFATASVKVKNACRAA